MKNYISLALGIVLILSLVLAGCTQPAPAAKPTPTPTPSPTPAQTQVIKLTYTDHNPQGGWGSTHASDAWFAQIDKATNGRVKVEAYYGETLAKAANAWTAVTTNVADIGWCFHGFWPNMTPLSDVISLPFLPFKNSRQASGVWWQLREKNPAIAKETAAVQTLLNFTTDTYFLITNKKQVKTMDDLKGLKIRTIGGPPQEQMTALGGVPVLIPSPEIYMSLQKGVLDGAATIWGMVEPFKLYETVNYYTFAPLYVGYFTMAMNKDKWNSLPPDVQKQIMSVSGYEGSRLYGYNYMDTVKDKIYQDMKKGGFDKIVEYTLTAEELAKWTEVGGKPIWEKWVKDMEGKGRPEAREVLNQTLELIKSNNP